MEKGENSGNQTFFSFSHNDFLQYAETTIILAKFHSFWEYNVIHLVSMLVAGREINSLPHDKILKAFADDK